MICKYLVKESGIHAVARMLAVLALGALIGGCSDEPETSGTPKFESDPPSVYMNDPAFRAALDTQQASKTKLLGLREKLLVQIEQMADATRAAMPGADDAMVNAELEKKPEWVSLQKRVADLQAALEDNRQATMDIVRERMAPKKISK